MASEHKPQRGDEAELFALFNDELVRRVSRSVRTGPETVMDACSIAWMQFLRYQPDRDQEWRGWLFRTAEREAWRLDKERYRAKSLDADLSEPAHAPEPRDDLDQYRQRDELEAAVDVLAQLPPRLRRI